MGAAHSRLVGSSCFEGRVAAEDKTETKNNLDLQQNHDRQHITSAIPPEMRVSVRLEGCVSDEDHRSKKKMWIDMLHPLKGEVGLIASGLEYRLVKIQVQDDGDVRVVEASTTSVTKESNDKNCSGTTTTASMMDHPNFVPENGNGNSNGNHCECQNENENEKNNNCVMDTNSKIKSQTRKDRSNINNTIMRLFHKESNTMITMTNRKEYIADGAMYDIICRLAMEYSIELMIKDGGLQWITIPAAAAAAEVKENQSEPIRALISTRLVEDESRLDNEPTLLIATGKGRVRAGIFSRQHLLTTGLECGSAIQFVREGRNRNMNIIILDPNVHGDRVGMITFERSISHLFRRWEEKNEEVTTTTTTTEQSTTLKQRNMFVLEEKNEEVITTTTTTTEKSTTLKQRNMFVLSHSHSGAQFVRYLLNKSDRYLPHIRAIAFTDSTHNIQWTKTTNQEGLRHLLESDKCVYFKRSDEGTKQILAPLTSIGKVINTDDFWKHRFGKIKTLCAGTSEHSLTNYFAKCLIWAHFDKYLPSTEIEKQRPTDIK